MKWLIVNEMGPGKFRHVIGNEALFLCAFQYLYELGCPLSYGKDAVKEIIDWLLNYAINIAYEQNGNLLLRSSS